MTLLTDPPAPVAGTPTPPATPPSSGVAAPVEGEKQANGKEPPAAPDKAAVDGKPKSGDAGVKPQGAPETYNFKPSEDGAEFDGDVLNAYTEAARELNLTQDAAQKMLDKMAPALQAQAVKNVSAMVDGWLTEAKADKLFSGEKAKENLAVAAKALALGSPELRKFLGPVKDGGTGLGNHVEILRWAHRIGSALSEDHFVSSEGSGDKPAAKSLEDRIYASKS